MRSPLHQIHISALAVPVTQKKPSKHPALKFWASSGRDHRISRDAVLADKDTCCKKHTSFIYLHYTQTSLPLFSYFHSLQFFIIFLNKGTTLDSQVLKCTLMIKDDLKNYLGLSLKWTWTHHYFTIDFLIICRFAQLFHTFMINELTLTWFQLHHNRSKFWFFSLMFSMSSVNFRNNKLIPKLKLRILNVLRKGKQCQLENDEIKKRSQGKIQSKPMAKLCSTKVTESPQNSFPPCPCPKAGQALKGFTEICSHLTLAVTVIFHSLI